VLADYVYPPLGELVPNPFGRAQGEEELQNLILLLLSLSSLQRK
jgi:hypothetical protein